MNASFKTGMINLHFLSQLLCKPYLEGEITIGEISLDKEKYCFLIEVVVNSRLKPEVSLHYFLNLIFNYIDTFINGYKPLPGNEF